MVGQQQQTMASSALRRMVLGLAVAVLMAAMLWGAAAPAFASNNPGTPGTPPGSSCGLGEKSAHSAIDNQAKPGAKEVATIPPANVGCTGN